MNRLVAFHTAIIWIVGQFMTRTKIDAYNPSAKIFSAHHISSANTITELHHHKECTTKERFPFLSVAAPLYLASSRHDQREEFNDGELNSTRKSRSSESLKQFTKDSSNAPIDAIEDSALSSESSSSDFEPLDVILERARRRRLNQIPILLSNLTFILNMPLFPSQFPIFFVTRGDALIVAISLVMDAKGFAIGLLIGKALLLPIQRTFTPESVPPILLQILPAMLGILYDQFV